MFTPFFNADDDDDVARCVLTKQPPDSIRRTHDKWDDVANVVKKYAKVVSHK